MATISKANQNDAKSIANIHFISWQATYDSLLPKAYIERENKLSEKIAMWKEVIPNANVNTWLASDYDDNQDGNQYDNQVGFISCFTKNDECEITTVYILPEYQKLGIGTQLMNTVIDDMTKSNQCDTVSVWVLKDNLSAIKFYEKLGFIAEGTIEEEEFEDTKITDIKMVKSITSL